MHESALTRSGGSRHADCVPPASPTPATRLAPRRAAAAAWGSLASLKVTVVTILWLAGGVAWSFDTGAPATWHVAMPLAAMALNLCAAVAVNRAFRVQTALLVFHLCLVAIMLLIGAGRLTYLRGQAEVAQGQAFDGTLIGVEAGPLHPWHVRALRFVNDGFEIDYAPGRRRAETRNAVRLLRADGTVTRHVVGDDRPLLAGGYRFYTSPNKGFAPRLLWERQGAAAQRGTLHLPPYPVYESVQMVEWTLPATQSRLEVTLLIDEVLIDETRASRFRLPADPKLRIRHGDAQFVLRPGQSVALAEGRLTFEGLGTWMGYTVYFDPTMPWLLATSLLAIVSLGWHLKRKYFARPWSAQ